MGTTTSGPAQVRTSFGIVSFIAGALAFPLSVGGQLLAARRLATDVNNGHPSADQSLIHALSVTPSLLLSVLAVWLGISACRNRSGFRKLALVGITVGVIAAGLTLVDVPGSLAARCWITPVPGGR
ncbi:MAG: hypothetical protein L0H74_13245 [Brachybacterium sp.]|nr:hypothetical protein [Brachybacterium sp.]